MNIRSRLINASIAHFEANIEKHRMNIEIILANPIAINDHTDIMGAIELELEKIAEYTDKLDAIKHFENNI